MKVAFFDAKPYDMEGFDRHIQGTDITIKYFETKLNVDTVSLANGYDCVCTFVNDVLDSEVVRQLKRFGIKMIALRCAGFNNVDTKECEIPIYRVPAYSPYAVAEHAMALLLTVVRRTHKAYNRTREFNFSLTGLSGFDLHGKTVGVIGTGKIGKVFADICKGFGMRVLAYDKYPDAKSGLDYVPLNTIFQESDVISLHCPLTGETRHLINDDSVEAMKPGVVIINTSRGALIDTESLINGLKTGLIGAACLDVYEEEADLFYEDMSGQIIQDDNLVRLIGMPNVIVTSHQAFLTREALDNIASTTVSNMQNFFAGTPNADREVRHHN